MFVYAGIGTSQLLPPSSTWRSTNHCVQDLSDDLRDDDDDVEENEGDDKEEPSNRVSTSTGAGEDSASVYCEFWDHKFVAKCVALRDLAVGETLTYDYWDNFLTDPGWHSDFKRRVGVLVEIKSHNSTWYM